MKSEGYDKNKFLVLICGFNLNDHGFGEERGTYVDNFGHLWTRL